MKYYTTGEAAKLLGVPPSTIRYYDKEGLLPFVKRSQGGMRMFSEEDLPGLRLVSCLKKAGLSIALIREFMQLPPDGEETITRRLSILEKQKKKLEEQRRILDEMEGIVDYKIWYYQTSKKAGTTSIHSNDGEQVPENLRPYYLKLHPNK
jgi:excisionase family DNA binding protein